MAVKPNPTCHDRRKCFAQEQLGRTRKICTILHATYQEGKCPFCKPVRDMTDGKAYPRNENYVGRTYKGNGKWE